jgi:hypothetical protein
MNSEEQISQDQTSLESTQQYLFNPLFILVAIGVGVVVVKKLLKLFEEDFMASDFPPIIIKSGSFTIETDDDDDNKLQLTTNSSPFIYKKMNFGKITGIRVFRIHEINGQRDSDFFDGVGLQVKIWLEFFINGIWTNITTEPQIIAGENNQAFELKLKFEKKLDDKKLKKHPRRTAKYDDKESKIFRFGRVEVLRGNTIIELYGDEYDHKNSDYVIGFFNYFS